MRVLTDLSGMAKDLSSMMSNPFESLGVATQAAEIQAEEADISLANTLDMLRATGASAGGATALAQAALASKKGVSSSIEQQEAQNERLKAQGAQALNASTSNRATKATKHCYIRRSKNSTVQMHKVNYLNLMLKKIEIIQTLVTI